MTGDSSNVKEPVKICYIRLNITVGYPGLWKRFHDWQTERTVTI